MSITPIPLGAHSSGLFDSKMVDLALALELAQRGSPNVGVPKRQQKSQEPHKPIDSV